MANKLVNNLTENFALTTLHVCAEQLGCKMTDVPAEIARLKGEIVRLNVYISQLMHDLEPTYGRMDNDRGIR